MLPVNVISARGTMALLSLVVSRHFTYRVRLAQASVSRFRIVDIHPRAPSSQKSRTVFSFAASFALINYLISPAAEELRSALKSTTAVGGALQ